MWHSNQPISLVLNERRRLSCVFDFSGDVSYGACLVDLEWGFGEAQPYPFWLYISIEPLI
jgi:hypothetical protein